MRRLDIRSFKNKLRNSYKEYRAGLSPQQKSDFDCKALENLKKVYQFKSAKLLLTYVSLHDEIDTINLIKYAFSKGMKVAVPRCKMETYTMDFYLITSLDDLEVGAFKVLEPNLDKCELLTNFDDSICVVPALSFDYKGFRLGYGKGFYDRFLADYEFCKVGLCYSECIKPKLPHGRYDVPVDLLVTEKYIRTIK